MNLKDCEIKSVPLLTVAELMNSATNPVYSDPIYSFELPPGSRVVAIALDSPGTAAVFYTVEAQGLPQEDIDRVVRLAVRKGLYLTDKEAVAGLTEHALHQYGVARLGDLTGDQYAELAKWLRFDMPATGAAPPSAL